MLFSGPLSLLPEEIRSLPTEYATVAAIPDISVAVYRSVDYMAPAAEAPPRAIRSVTGSPLVPLTALAVRSTASLYSSTPLLVENIV